MSSASSPITIQLTNAVSAANADELEERRAASAAARNLETGGWDAYEVWRRFIKDARDRRQQRQD